jgi:2-hydroxy-3-oxopropionate reductase
MLMVMGGSAVYVGPIGSGNVAKLANQMIVAINIAACAEAFTFAAKMGTDPELVYQAIRGGLAGSTVMDAKVPMMIDGNYKPGFRIALHTKDLTNALNAAHAINSPAPFTAQAMEILQFLNAHDCGADDHDAIVKYYEAISGTSVVKEK